MSWDGVARALASKGRIPAADLCARSTPFHAVLCSCLDLWYFLILYVVLDYSVTSCPDRW